jgi:hypothetical protein
LVSDVDPLNLGFIPVHAKKPDAKDPLDRMEKKKEENRVDDKTQKKPAPPHDARCRDDEIRKQVSCHDRREDAAEKYQPSFDPSHFHGYQSSRTVFKGETVIRPCPAAGAQCSSPLHLITLYGTTDWRERYRTITG